MRNANRSAHRNAIVVLVICRHTPLGAAFRSVGSSVAVISAPAVVEPGVGVERAIAVDVVCTTVVVVRSTLGDEALHASGRAPELGLGERGGDFEFRESFH